MKYLKLTLCLMIISSLLSGCFFKKKKPVDSGSFYGTDTPLEEFPLENFYEPVGEEVKVFKEIHFDYNSYSINASEMVLLKPILDWLENNPKMHLLIEGHCDERGSNEYNLALGEQRALAVRSHFVSKGISASRLQTISYGEERPLDPGHDEGAWKQNRRCHFLIGSK